MSKINMTGGARRGTGTIGGLRPLTAARPDGGVSGGSKNDGRTAGGGSGSVGGGSGGGTGQGAAGVDEQEEKRRQALARHRSWADDYHYSGW